MIFHHAHPLGVWGNSALLVARVAISIIFLWAGVRKLLHWGSTEEYMKVKSERWIPILLPLAVAFQIVGGLSLVLGFYARLGALLLIIFTLPATTRMHDWWNLVGSERIEEKAHFLKDLAIVGGLILLMMTGAGAYSING